MQTAFEGITALWPIFAAFGVFFMGGVVRVELLNFRVKYLERAKEAQDSQMSSLRKEVETINGDIAKELREVRESLAWIKGRFMQNDDRGQ